MTHYPPPGAPDGSYGSAPRQPAPAGGRHGAPGPQGRRARGATARPPAPGVRRCTSPGSSPCARSCSATSSAARSRPCGATPGRRSGWPLVVTFAFMLLPILGDRRAGRGSGCSPDSTCSTRTRPAARWAGPADLGFVLCSLVTAIFSGLSTDRDHRADRAGRRAGRGRAADHAPRGLAGARRGRLLPLLGLTPAGRPGHARGDRRARRDRPAGLGLATGSGPLDGAARGAGGPGGPGA